MKQITPKAKCTPIRTFTSGVAVLISSLLLGGTLLFNSCSNDIEGIPTDGNSRLVPLVVTGQLPATAGNVLTRANDNIIPDVDDNLVPKAINQVILELEYPGMEIDKARTTGRYNITLGTQDATTGAYSCTLAPYGGNPESEETRNANTVRVPADGVFTLRIHGMAGEALPISHLADNVRLDASGKLNLGSLTMASTHIAIVVEGAYGEGEVVANAFQISYGLPLYPPQTDANNICQWQKKPEATHDDGTGLGNPWLLIPDRTRQTTGVTSTTSQPLFADLAAPDTLDKGKPFIVLTGVDRDATGQELKHGYTGKTYRIAAAQQLIHEAGKSYTYTVKLAETTATIIDLKVGDWEPGADFNTGNQPGIYTAQDFRDFAKAWNESGEAGIGLRKYRQWMDYTDAVTLMNPIDLDADFTPIGTDANPFNSTFSGNGMTITATGPSLFGTVGKKGRLNAITRMGSITGGAGIAHTNNGYIMVCVNAATVNSGAGIADTNEGSLYACLNIGVLKESTAGIATNTSRGYAYACFYLSPADDGHNIGSRVANLKDLDGILPGLNNGVYKSGSPWAYESSSSPSVYPPKLVRKWVYTTPGIFSKEDLIAFSTTWNAYGAESIWGFTYDSWITSGEYIRLYIDINLGNGTGFNAIGTAKYPFNSKANMLSFDGQGHTITLNGGSLFGETGSKSILMNLVRAGEVTAAGQAGIATKSRGTIISCINTATVSGAGAAGIAALCLMEEPTPPIQPAPPANASEEETPAIRKSIVSCINTAATTGADAIAIAPNPVPVPDADGQDPSDACYYVGINRPNSCGNAVASLAQINTTETIATLNTGILNWNTTNNTGKKCNWHYLMGTPAGSAVPTLKEGKPNE